ncbi:MAG: RNA 3'-terminal phosphate cyclase [Candidatus Methanofastidiosa archaeon]|nr:RNA 3'-terminal phosphate cyclase [Candidatus Methanofastidiosa archaeon]
MMHIMIDGSLGEGGGQILRTSLALSAISNIGIDVENIRVGRPNPGLRPQHLCSLNAIREITSADMSGGKVGSLHVSFLPRGIKPGDYLFDIGTAGSVTLLAHTLLLPLLLCEERSTITLKGGTDVPWSPTTSYYENVTLEVLRKLGIDVHFEASMRGYYPKGGGIVKMEIEPWLDRSPLGDVRVRKPRKLFIDSSCSGLSGGVAERQAASAEKVLGEFETEMVNGIPGSGIGSSITIWAQAGDLPIGFSAIGKRGYLAEDVGRDAALGILRVIEGHASDEHLPDQLIPFLLFPDGRSSIPIPAMTGHLSTNIQVSEKFMNFEHTYEKGKLEIRKK